MKKHKNSSYMLAGKCENVILNVIFILAAAMSIVPFLLLVMISLSSEYSLVTFGYRLIPRQYSLAAYIFLISKSNALIRAYIISVLVTVIGTVMSVTITLMFAYPLSREDFKYRYLFSFVVFFSMIFHGGLIASYMVNTQMLGLKNNLLIYVVPFLMSSWNVMLMRTFLKTSIPSALVEAAKIDGCGEMQSFWRIIVPLSLPGIATIALLSGIAIWNDWFTGVLYVTESNKQSLQYMMYKTINDAEYIKKNMNTIGGNAASIIRNMPTESARMAMCVIAIGPIVILYPFLQKYFIKGMVIGAIKG